MKVLIVMRGLSGSGKTTAAEVLLKHLGGGAVRLSTDDKFGTGENYRFVPEKLSEYHDATFADALEAFERGVPVVLDNTNTQRWHYERYVTAARKRGYGVVQCNLYDGGLPLYLLSFRSVRGLSFGGIRSQKRAWQEDESLDDIGGYVRALVDAALRIGFRLDECQDGGVFPQ